MDYIFARKLFQLQTILGGLYLFIILYFILCNSTPIILLSFNII